MGPGWVVAEELSGRRAAGGGENVRRPRLRRNVTMGETASAFSGQDQRHNGGNGATAPGPNAGQNRCEDVSRRLLRRPTTADTERIARECPAEGLSVPVIVSAIRRETGCS